MADRRGATPVQTAGHDKGLGGQPVVQPNGRVIVPFESLNGQIQAFISDDGGASWSDGTVYVAWEDCRFRKNCTSNDIVFSSSADGVTWSAPARVPIDDVTSGVD